MTLKRTDVGANKAPELENLAWTMKVTKSGGVGDAPTLTISTADGDQLETSTLSVSGDHLTLSREECASASGGYSVVTSAYRWKIVAGRLSMTPVKTGCPDKVASTILGSRRWKRGS